MRSRPQTPGSDVYRVSRARGQFIVCLRGLGYTQQQIAERLGLSDSRVSQIEMKYRRRIEHGIHSIQANLSAVDAVLTNRRALYKRYAEAKC